ncbi:hypothetical protein AAMO2058_000696200 [Amorphochlora amoebiformis]
MRLCRPWRALASFRSPYRRGFSRSSPPSSSIEGTISAVGVGGALLGGGYALRTLISNDLTEQRGNDEIANTAGNGGEGEMVGLIDRAQKPLIICGPSGVGKGTILRLLFSEFPDQFGYSVSHTTRQPRPGEVDGKNYYFVDNQTMRADIDSGLFVEHATFAGNMYGTSIKALSAVAKTGKVPVLEVDIQGALQLFQHKDIQPLFCFIKPPSYQELERRLKDRGTEDSKKIETRLTRAKEELKFIESPDGDFFQVVFVNDNLEKSFE